MLKTHANPAEKDSLLSYLNTDRVMRAQMAKIDAAQAKPEQKVAPAPSLRQLPSGRKVSESQYLAWRKRGGRWPSEG